MYFHLIMVYLSMSSLWGNKKALSHICIECQYKILNTDHFKVICLWGLSLLLFITTHNEDLYIYCVFVIPKIIINY